VEVPQVHVQEVIRHVTKTVVQEVVRHVPKIEMQIQERVVEVPHISTVEKIVEVPKVHVQEIVKHVTKHVFETRERIVEVPCVQVQERIVEHPEIHVQEVTKHVPKVVEVQEIVKNVQKVDWAGASPKSIGTGTMTGGGSLEAPTLPPSTPQAGMLHPSKLAFPQWNGEFEAPSIRFEADGLLEAPAIKQRFSPNVIEVSADRVAMNSGPTGSMLRNASASSDATTAVSAATIQCPGAPVSHLIPCEASRPVPTPLQMGSPLQPQPQPGPFSDWGLGGSPSAAHFSGGHMPPGAAGQPWQGLGGPMGHPPHMPGAFRR